MKTTDTSVISGNKGDRSVVRDFFFFIFFFLLENNRFRVSPGLPAIYRLSEVDIIVDSK